MLQSYCPYLVFLGLPLPLLVGGVKWVGGGGVRTTEAEVYWVEHSGSVSSIETTFLGLPLPLLAGFPPGLPLPLLVGFAGAGGDSKIVDGSASMASSWSSAKVMFLFNGLNRFFLYKCEKCVNMYG